MECLLNVDKAGSFADQCIDIIIVIWFARISLLFIKFVLLSSFLVIYDRGEYISGDINLNQFILSVVIFVLSIIILIIIPNII